MYTCETPGSKTRMIYKTGGSDMLTKMIESLKKNPRTIVFPEGSDYRILSAAERLTKDGILKVLLLGNEEEIKAAAKKDNYCIDGSYALCRKAKEKGIPLEYNLYGLEKGDLVGHPGLGYPCSFFWEIAKDVGCQAIIGYDAHYLRHFSNPKYIAKAENYLSKLGIDVLRTLPGLE